MLILASQSSARKSLLAGAGLRFEASPAQIDERAIEAEVLGKGAGPADVARKLAEAKALAVSANRAEAVVIGADQVLAVPGSATTERFEHSAPPHPASPARGEVPGDTGERIFHKPASMAGAAAQLNELRGRTHWLHSGVALARDGVVLWSAVETASLTMRDFSDVERDAVLTQEGEAVLGSVGGYRLEGPSVKLFERIDGDYFTILGLPLLPLLAVLRQHAPDALE